MDADWFAARMKLLGLTQDHIAHELKVDRSTVSRILAGQRPLTLKELEPVANILQVPVTEVLERVQEFDTPPRIHTAPRSDLLEMAITVAGRVLAGETSRAESDLALLAQAIYGQLIEEEARGQPIADDERTLRIIVGILRRVRTASKPRGNS